MIVTRPQTPERAGLASFGGEFKSCDVNRSQKIVGQLTGSFRYIVGIKTELKAREVPVLDTHKLTFLDSLVQKLSRKLSIGAATPPAIAPIQNKIDQVIVMLDENEAGKEAG